MAETETPEHGMVVRRADDPDLPDSIADIVAQLRGLQQ